MSRIDDLIQQFAPDGVDFKALRQLGTWVGGITPSKSVARYWEGGTVPWVTSMDVSTTSGREIRGRITQAAVEETSLRLVPSPAVAVVMRSNVLRRFLPMGYIDIETTVNQDLRLLTPHEGIDARYAYWALQAGSERIRQNCVRTDGSMAAVNSKAFFDWRIPVPPLEVQREIVRILDHFTALEAELEAELAAELAARRTQYAHYRQHLLTFSDEAAAERLTLGDVCTRVTSGATPLSGRSDYYDGGQIPWLRTQEVIWRDIVDTDIKITQKALKETAAKWIPVNCVIVAISGASAARAAVNKIPLTTNQHCCNLEVDPAKAQYRYVYQWVAANYETLRALGQGARSDLNGGLIKSFPIDVPPLDEQQRIVDVLDQLDRLGSDLGAEVTAESNARRQQYEYYREKLLTFEEAAA